MPKEIGGQGAVSAREKYLAELRAQGALKLTNNRTCKREAKEHIGINSI